MQPRTTIWTRGARPFCWRGAPSTPSARILDSCRARIDGDALALIGACFDALYNLANDTNAAAAVVEGGLCEACVHLLRLRRLRRAGGPRCEIDWGTADVNAVQRLSRCGAAAVLADALRSRADDLEEIACTTQYWAWHAA